jgi:hypothetical protein
LWSCGYREFGCGVGCEGAVDDVGEAAFKDAEGFETAVSVGASAGEHRSCVWVDACLGERYAVDRRVELPVG